MIRFDPDVERSEDGGVVNIAKRIFGENAETENTEQVPTGRAKPTNFGQSQTAETESVPTSIDPGVTISNYSNRGTNTKT